MVKVKICGVTNFTDTVTACKCGADLVGFIFIEGTPRAIDAYSARNIIMDLPHDLKEKVGKVGLFKDEQIERVAEVIAYCSLDYVQLHGGETPAECVGLKKMLRDKYERKVNIIKVFKVSDRILPHGEYSFSDYDEADYFVFDTFHPQISGGTGSKFDWEVLVKEKDQITRPFFIAGGLTPGNVSGVVKAINPYGVDVSSGVEKTPRKKDEDLVKEFIKNAKKI